MKPSCNDIRSVFLYGSGTSGTPEIYTVGESILRAVDIGVGLMVGELAAATVASYVTVWKGEPPAAYGNTSQATNLIASVYQPMRSNATFAQGISLARFFPNLAVPFNSRDFITLDWVAAANHTLYGWVTLHFELI